MNWRGAGDPVARFSRVRTLVSVSALLALTAVAANAAAPPPKLDLRAVPVPPPTFSHLPPKWRAFATPGDLTPRGAQAGVFATSWPYRLTTVAGPAGSMPRDAVLVNVFLIRSNPGKQRAASADEPRTSPATRRSAACHFSCRQRRRRRSTDRRGRSTASSAASASRTTSRSGSTSVTDTRRRSYFASLASSSPRSTSRAGQGRRPARAPIRRWVRCRRARRHG
jgi:hypothetical protein